MGRKLLVYLLTAVMLFSSTGQTAQAAGLKMSFEAKQGSITEEAAEKSEGAQVADETENSTGRSVDQENATEQEIPVEENDWKEEEASVLETVREEQPDDSEIPASTENEIGNAETEEKSEDAEIGMEAEGTEAEGIEVDSESGDTEEIETSEDSESEDELSFQKSDVNATGEVGTSGVLGENYGINWSYDSDTKTLIVSGEDELHGKYEKGDFISPFYSICRSMAVEKIKLDECSLLGSAEALFCSLMVSEIDLSGLDTSRVTNVSNMFYKCGTLVELDLSRFDTSNVTDMNYMFFGCHGLSTLDLSHFDTSKVTGMIGMFNGCNKLETLDLSNFNTSNVMGMSNMFSSCNKLETLLGLSNFDTSNVTDMRGMFSDCSSLEVLDLSSFGSSNVMSTREMFDGCSSLITLDLSNLETSSATDMRRMFYGCSSLTTLDISKLDTGNVTDMSSMFYGCESLTTLDVSKFDTGSVTDMSSMFYDCESLTTLDVSKFDTGSVTGMSNMFNGCSSLGTLDVSHFDTHNVTNMQGVFCDCSSLDALDVSHFDTSNVNIMEYMFAGCSGLSSLDVSHFDTSNVTQMEGMFKGCSGLSSLDLSHFDTGSVQRMTRMFQWCNSLTSLDLSHFNTNNVTSMDWMFDGCKGLISLDLSHFNTTGVTGMGYMFSNCSSLTSLDVSHFDTSNVTGMAGMFAGCSGLSSLDVSHFDTSNVTDNTGMASMFSGCSGLVSLDVSHFDTSYVNDMARMFKGCSGLESLDLSDFDTKNVKDMAGMFRDCSSLKHLDISNFDTSKVTDMGWMFSGCSDLADLDVSRFNTSQVTGVLAMEYMFEGCSSLKSLDLGNFDMRGVTKDLNMSGMFSKCDSLDILYTPKAIGSKTVNLPETFYDGNDTGYTTLSSTNTNKVLTRFHQSSAYRIQFNGNGTEQGFMRDQYIETGVGQSLYANAYRKPGYAFVGWDTAADGSGTRYTDKETVTDLATAKGTIILYAQWKPATYTIRFIGNGSTEGTLADIENCTGDKEYTLPENTYKKRGYIFKGWNTRSNGKGISYDDKATVKNLTSKDGGIVTLYAQWTIEEYTITYILNDGENHADNPSVYNITSKTITLKEASRTGYAFDGWYSNESLTDQVVDIAKGSVGNKTLYAKWTANVYKIKFDGNGATDGKMDALNCVFDKKHILPENTYQRSGYSFTGWNTKANGYGTEYNDKAEILNLSEKSGEEFTFYAQWSAVKYNIVYELDGGSNIANPKSYYVYTDTFTLSEPFKMFYVFDGWYSDAAFTKKVTKIEQGSTGDKTFYAKWLIYTYTVKFDGNGATVGSLNSLNCAYGEKYTLPENTYQWDGYTFKGWNTNADGSGTTYGDKAEIKDISMENGVTVTLYAQWIKKDGADDGEDKKPDNGTGEDEGDNKKPDDGTNPDDGDNAGDGSDIVNKHGRYKIAYSLSGGKNNTKNPSSYDRDWNTITLAVPTRPGYNFAGWYSNAALTKGVAQIKSGSIGNIFLFAKWMPHKYSISFDGNGADSGSMPDQQCSYGTLKELSVNKYWKNGCGFIGWNTKADGTGTSYRNRDGVLNLTERDGGSVTLYAQWKPDAYAITYVTGGGSNKGNPDWYESGTGGITLQAPAREGYTFKGWYADSKYKKKSAVIPAGSAEDKTFYAKWAANKYTVRFDGNDPTSGKMAAMKNRVYAKKFKLSANKFKKKGYTFLGWNTEADGTGIPYKNKASVSSLTGDAKGEVTLYAMWQETRYKITYKPNKGTNNLANPSVYTVGSDTITLADPVRDGYTFMGWYSDAKFKKRVTQIGQGSTGNKTLYAKWKKG